MSDDYAGKIIAQMTRLTDKQVQCPRGFRAKRKRRSPCCARFHRTAPPSWIYQYISSAALISIIATNELWLPLSIA